MDSYLHLLVGLSVSSHLPTNYYYESTSIEQLDAWSSLEFGTNILSCQPPIQYLFLISYKMRKCVNARSLSDP